MPAQEGGAVRTLNNIVHAFFLTDGEGYTFQYFYWKKRVSPVYKENRAENHTTSVRSPYN
jgi:hypothetical protein